jgi:hypothetical protein
MRCYVCYWEAQQAVLTCQRTSFVWRACCARLSVMQGCHGVLVSGAANPRERGAAVLLP